MRAVGVSAITASTFPFSRSRNALPIASKEVIVAAGIFFASISPVVASCTPILLPCRSSSRVMVESAARIEIDCPAAAYGSVNATWDARSGVIVIAEMTTSYLPARNPAMMASKGTTVSSTSAPSRAARARIRSTSNPAISPVPGSTFSKGG